MTDSVAKPPLTSPKRTAAEDKAQITNAAAWQIITSERTARDNKSARLKELRLQQDASPLKETAKKSTKAGAGKH